jgi:hypothetical protein
VRQPAKIVPLLPATSFCAAAVPRHDAVVEALDVQICWNHAAVEVGPLRQNIFLSELIKRLSQIDARLKHRGRLLEHREIFYQFSFAGDAAMAWNNFDVVWRMRQDVAGLFNHVAPQQGSYRSRPCHWWDFSDLLSWPQVHAPVRVVRSLETYTVRRQLDKQDEPQTSDWIWATTLPPAQVPVDRVVHLGHQRWDIENYGFNELVNEWHSDHVFKHDPQAIECFLLVAFLAYNIFHAFLTRNVKPCARKGKTQIYWARLIAAELYSEVAPAGMSP